MRKQINDDKFQKVLNVCLAILAVVAALMSAVLAAYMFMSIFGLLPKGG